MLTSYSNDNASAIQMPVVTWGVEPGCIMAAERHRRQVGLTGLYATLHLGAAPADLAWGIIAVGGPGDVLLGYQPSNSFNPLIVSTFLDEQDRLRFELSGVAEDAHDRREAVIGMILLYSWLLVVAGAELLNCRADQTTTNHFLEELRKSAIAIETGRSHWESEVERLRSVLEAADCGKRTEAA
jgi:hypothetical protein